MKSFIFTEVPLLISERIFHIKQYYLVTSTYPLHVWTYQDCFLKIGLQNDNVINGGLREPVNLTDQAVRKLRNDFDPQFSKNNICQLQTFKKYLKDIGKAEVWDNVINPGMKKIIVGVMLSNQESLKQSKNRFGFHCCDFIIDHDFRPWLVKINDSPNLYPLTNAKIGERVVSDVIKGKVTLMFMNLC